jgi:hypothetical protein
MLITRKSASISPSDNRLADSHSAMPGKTIDRRTFLTRSSVALGAGAAATQLPINFVETVGAAQDAGRTVDVKRAIPMQFYHDFRVLGLDLPQLPGSYARNQATKAPIIIGYLLFAMGKLKARRVSPLTVGELFCADAFYSFIARRFGADRCDAFDNDRDGYLEQARVVRGLLNETNVAIHKTDVFDMPSNYRASIILNAGGLYHVTDPLRALERSYAMCQHYLIVQTVVTLATEDDNYFETPAPGWTWGSRFSYGFLRREITKRGYRIVDTDRNVLTGNDRPEDRGSAYFLIARDDR